MTTHTRHTQSWNIKGRAQQYGSPQEALEVDGTVVVFQHYFAFITLFRGKPESSAPHPQEVGLEIGFIWKIIDLNL